MSRHKKQKCRLQVEGLEARDMLSASAYTGIVRAGAVVSPQAVDQSKVCLDAVVVTPEGQPPTITCSDGGFVPLGQLTALDKHQDDSAGAPVVRGIGTAVLAMPPQAQGVEHSQVCFDAVVVTPEGQPPTIICPDGGFVPPGQLTALGQHVDDSAPATVIRDLVARAL